jgi:hypothetical protein
MTDYTRYRNISLSNETYNSLKELSKQLLPGETELSISKTVETLVNERKRKKVSAKEFRESGKRLKDQKTERVNND